MKKLVFVFILLVLSSSVIATEVETRHVYDYQSDLSFVVLGGHSYGDYLEAKYAIRDRCKAVLEQNLAESKQCEIQCDGLMGIDMVQCYNPCIEAMKIKTRALRLPIFSDLVKLSKNYNEKVLIKTLPSGILENAKQEHDTIFNTLFSCIDSNTKDEKEKGYGITSMCDFTPGFGGEVCYKKAKVSIKSFADKYEKLQKEPYCTEDPDCIGKVVKEDKDDEELEPVEKIKPKLVPKTFGEPFKKLTFSKGQIEMLRGGKVEKVTKDIEFQAGDIIHTGDDGGMEIATEDGTIKLGKDTTLEFVGLKFDPVPSRRVISPPPEAPWALDRSVRYEIDNEVFWDGFAEDIKGFVEETNIDLEIIGCMSSASIIGCMSSAASVLHSGSVWFEKEIKKDFGISVVITPKSIFFPDGTEFSVDVADDGSTTVTVFDGRVVAIDLESREIEVVGVGEQLTTGSEVTTIDLESIDKWWSEELAQEKSLAIKIAEWFGFSMILIIVFMVIFVPLFLLFFLFVKRKHCPKCKAPLPKLRIPKSFKQAVRGLATCSKCGSEVKLNQLKLLNKKK